MVYYHWRLLSLTEQGFKGEYGRYGESKQQLEVNFTLTVKDPKVRGVGRSLLDSRVLGHLANVGGGGKVSNCSSCNAINQNRK